MGSRFGWIVSVHVRSRESNKVFRKVVAWDLRYSLRPGNMGLDKLSRDVVKRKIVPSPLLVVDDIPSIGPEARFELQIDWSSTT